MKHLESIPFKNEPGEENSHPKQKKWQKEDKIKNSCEVNIET